MSASAAQAAASQAATAALDLVNQALGKVRMQQHHISIDYNEPQQRHFSSLPPATFVASSHAKPNCAASTPCEHLLSLPQSLPARRLCVAPRVAPGRLLTVAVSLVCRVRLLQSGDARFFQTTKKGEVMELKTDLNSQNKDKVKDAVKKVIASMTVGKDVSSLFTDVIKSMQTDNIELKKLVYLYIINYARSQPDKAILIVNTFQKDAMSSSPLIRALAIRTMGCIRVDRITEYLG